MTDSHLKFVVIRYLKALNAITDKARPFSNEKWVNLDRDYAEALAALNEALKDE